MTAPRVRLGPPRRRSTPATPATGDPQRRAPSGHLHADIEALAVVAVARRVQHTRVHPAATAVTLRDEPGVGVVDESEQRAAAVPALAPVSHRRAPRAGGD